MPSATLRMLGSAAAPAQDYFLAREKLLVGNPRQTLWLHYTDASAQFSAGVWRSEPGKWTVQYTEEEYCHVLQGVSVVTDQQGHATTVQTGDEFVIPRGFAGTWAVIETTTKRFVLYEATAPTNGAA